MVVDSCAKAILGGANIIAVASKRAPQEYLGSHANLSSRYRAYSPGVQVPRAPGLCLQQGTPSVGLLCCL